MFLRSNVSPSESLTGSYLTRLTRLNWGTELGCHLYRLVSKITIEPLISDDPSATRPRSECKKSQIIKGGKKIPFKISSQ